MDGVLRSSSHASRGHATSRNIWEQEGDKGRGGGWGEGRKVNGKDRGGYKRSKEREKGVGREDLREGEKEVRIGWWKGRDRVRKRGEGGGDCAREG